MRRVAGHMLCRGRGIRALVGMDYRHAVDVGLRRMLHAIMVRDDAGRRIQRGHAARHITERRTTRAGRNHAGLRSQLPNMPQYDAMQITTVIARWVWIIPVVATLVRCRNAGAHADDMGAALIAVLLALHVVLGFMVGLLCARNVTLTRQNKRLQDSKRDQIRRLRSQLAESEEDRAASVRGHARGAYTHSARDS